MAKNNYTNAPLRVLKETAIVCFLNILKNTITFRIYPQEMPKFKIFYCTAF